MDSFLKRNPQNIVAIHCKAGKGRTGVMISTYLLHSQYSFKNEKGELCTLNTVKDALLYYGINRTSNGKGVTCASQLRYVHYYGEAMEWARKEGEHIWQEIIERPKKLYLTKIKLVTIPIISFSGCSIFIKI